MRIQPIKHHDLPSNCHRGISSNCCGISFTNKKNLYQGNDGTVYCTGCGVSFGSYPSGTISFRKRDDNLIP
jgi:hypothetical protein